MTGKKTGGRQKGSENKDTPAKREKRKQTAELVQSVIPDAFEGDAYAFLVATFKDPTVEFRERLRAASVAIAYERPRLVSEDVSLKLDVSENFEKLWTLISNGVAEEAADRLDLGSVEVESNGNSRAS